MDHWYELRVSGSAGTRDGDAIGMKEGIAVAEGGRLCALASGRARRFGSRQEALDYLGQFKVSGDYTFEAALCGAGPDAERAGAAGEPAPGVLPRE